MNRRTFLLNTTAAGFALAAQPLQAAATLPPISTYTLEQAVATGSPKTLDVVAAHRESLANTRSLFDWLS